MINIASALLIAVWRVEADRGRRRRTRAKTVLVAGLSSILCACAVPIRYEVPAKQIVRRSDVFARDRRFETTHRSETGTVKRLELPNGDTFTSTSAVLNRRLEALVAASPEDTVVLLTDEESRVGPVVGAILGFSAGALAGAFGAPLLVATRNEQERNLARLMAGPPAALIGMLVGLSIGYFVAVSPSAIEF